MRIGAFPYNIKCVKIVLLHIKEGDDLLQIGDKISFEGNMISVLRFLGKGKGGYSYLVQYKEHPAVLKKLHYEKCEVYNFGSDKLEAELWDYETLRKLQIPMPELFGFNRDEQYLLKEYIKGPSLAELLAQQALPLSYFVQMREMCRILYANCLNIDYMPQNFIVKDRKLFYVDFECNKFSEEWDFEHWGIYFWVNREGMRKFLETGEYGYLSVDGKPVVNEELRKRAVRALEESGQ